MANFSYKESKNTVLKAVGILDSENMVIDIDGSSKKLSVLLQDFANKTIEINVKIKEENELDEPTEVE